MTSPSVQQKGVADAIDLNNAATSLIESGHYDGAITALQQALRLMESDIRNENNTDHREKNYCLCDQCTLDGCINFSERQRSAAQSTKYVNVSRENSSSSSSSIGSSGRRIHRTDAIVSSNKRRRIEYRNENDESTNACHKGNERGYIYQSPILIPKDHEIGSILFFVILFNLSLAHHLKALVITGKTGCKSESKSKSESDKKTLTNNEHIRKALLIYELMFEYWKRLHADSRSNGLNGSHEDPTSSTSFRFMMILYNNISEMYRLAKDTIRQRQCLQKLLSIVMIAIESKNRNAASSVALQRTPVLQTYGSSDGESDGNRNGETDAFWESLDGFIANTAVIMMPQKVCAQAA